MPGEVGLRNQTVIGQRVELALSVAVSEPTELRLQAGALEALGLQERLHEVAVRQGEGGQGTSLSSEPLWVFKGALEDEPGDGVDVHGGHLAAQSHGFEGDGAAAREGVQHLGGASAVGLANLVAEPLEVWAVLAPPVEDAALGNLLHLLNGAPVEPLALDLLDDAPGHAIQHRLAFIGVARVRQQRGDERSARGRQGSPRWPDVQRRDVPVPHILLMHRVQRRLLEREGYFNEALVARGGHGVFPMTCLVAHNSRTNFLARSSSGSCARSRSSIICCTHLGP